jgi:voltage-gated potassium channel
LRSFRVVLPALLFFALVILMATLGYICMGWPAFDAFYMVVITVFSVGYGETRPVDTQAERWWTIIVIFAGWAAVVITLGGLVKAVTEGEFRRAASDLRRTRDMQHLHNHIIICGYGRIGQTIARELRRSRVPFVIIDRDEERIAQINVDGYLSYRGDATEEATLEAAGIARARVLATVLPQDALNVFITLTARNLSQSIRILARGEQPSTAKKLHQAGANEVILPATISGLRIAHSITHPEVDEFLADARGHDFHSLGVEIDELTLHDHAHLVGLTVGQLQERAPGELMVLAVRREGRTLRQQLDSLQLQEQDGLIVISRTGNLPAIIGREVDRTELL